MPVFGSSTDSGLPFSGVMSEEQVEHVCEHLRRIVEASPALAS
ncbi:MAG TPA: hypothetical protein VJL59_15495 [Anaerolineales bacterium]|nr:hypothetical protein [Anaerolineales bacterium]